MADKKRRNKKEITDNIYENMDRTESLGVNRPYQDSGSEPVRSRNFRAATVCLGLLCAVLLAAVIVLCVQIITERNQFHIKSKNYTEERDQFRKENEELRARIKGQGKWVNNRHSSYYISSEWKTWTESRQDCLQRGADLAIINNEEEHTFINGVTSSNKVWIGLTDSEREGTWKWVDGSTVTPGFWSPGEPNSNAGSEDCGVSMFTRLFDYPCHLTFVWICEKRI